VEKVEQANKISIVDYLSKLGYTPAREGRYRFSYISPLRNENKPSFYVFLNDNSWYDFGDGRGGDIISLVRILNNCGFNEALNILLHGKYRQSAPIKKAKINRKEIEVLRVDEIESLELVLYLEKRMIDIRIAWLYCREVDYFFPFGKYPNRLYTSIGFQNNKGGWELRSPYFKVSSYPKYFTEIKGNEKLCLFEGFFNMLSFLTYYKKERINSTIIVLNSWSTIKYVDICKFKKVYLYLDNDQKKNNELTPAQKVINYIEEAKIDYKDCRYLYKDFNDFNSFLTNGKY